MYSTNTWQLLPNEIIFIQFEGIQSRIRSNIGDYTRNARILFCTARIIIEFQSTLGGVKSTVIIGYDEIDSIRISSEFANHGLSISDRDGNSIWFNFYRNNLRGTQIYLQIFYCHYAKWHHCPAKVLEEMTRLHIESRVPCDIFTSDVTYERDFQNLLTEWGVVLEQDCIPWINGRLPLYQQEQNPQENQIKTNSSEQKNDHESDELVEITDVLANTGDMVYANQAILRVKNIHGIFVERNICAGETGYISYKEIDITKKYKLSDTLNLFIIKQGKKSATSSNVERGRDNLIHNRLQSENTSRPPTPGVQKIIKEFNSLPGLANAKEVVKEITSTAVVNQKRKESGLDPLKISYHMIFTGNPGTGKTTIARKIGSIFKELGVLSKGHFIEVQRSDLVGGYLGQTAIKTQEIIERSLGGILFIDEAYSLSSQASNDQFGNEAINTLVAAMENHRDNLIVIAAGYREEMSSFINSNPGLSSRFARTLHFPDYSDLELFNIFWKMTVDSNMTLDAGCIEIVKEIIAYIGKKRGKGFGNAREIRSTFEKILIEQNIRLSTVSATKEQLLSITRQDLLSVKGKIIPSVNTSNANANTELQQLIGLNGVKEEIMKLINLCSINTMRKKKGLSVASSSLHMVFTGNPGTGKTTVARIIAKSLFEIGYLSKNLLVEVCRSDLVAGFVGQTALKTTTKLESALGGVLFIDEAYSLFEDSDKHNFGKEALETILKFMEDNKDNIVVIIAGYTEEMNLLLNSNPGLRSRFNRFIQFADYTPNQLARVFVKIATSSDYTLSKDFNELLIRFIEKNFSHKTKSFGNGRAMRNLFEKVIERQAERLSRSRIIDQSGLMELSANDLIEDDVLAVIKT